MPRHRVLKFCLKLLLFFGIMAVTDHAVDSYLKKGLNRYYGFDNGAQVLCVGHSRTIHAVDSHWLEQAVGVPVAKYALAGTDTFDRLMMIHHYLGQHPAQTRVVVYDVDYFTFNGRTTGLGRKNDQFKHFFPFMDNAEVAAYVKKRSRWGEYTSRKLVKSLRYNDPAVLARAIISHFKTDPITTGKIDMGNYRKGLAAENTGKPDLIIDPGHVGCFEEILKLLRSRDIKVVLFYLPVVDIERDRIDRQYREKVIGMFRGYAARDPGVVFLEDAMKYEHAYDLFCDPWHVNRAGQSLVTDDLARAVKGIM
jgi:hypothetical protein